MNYKQYIKYPPLVADYFTYNIKKYLVVGEIICQ